MSHALKLIAAALLMLAVLAAILAITMAGRRRQRAAIR